MKKNNYFCYNMDNAHLTIRALSNNAIYEKVESNIIPKSTIKKIHIGDWYIPIGEAMIRIYSFFDGYFIAKNNKKILKQCACEAIISSEDANLNYISLERLNDLKIKKEILCVQNLIIFLEKQLNKKTGIKGHKGYFEFQNILPCEN